MILKLTKYTNTPGTFEAEWLDDDKSVRVIAYSGDQIGLFRADVAQYGGEVDEALIAEVKAEWVPPPPPVPMIPQVVTMRQARLALLSAGLLDQVDAALAAIPDATDLRAAQIEWEYSNAVERGSQWVNNLAGALGLTQQQLDDLFAQAATL